MTFSASDVIENCLGWVLVVEEMSEKQEKTNLIGLYLSLQIRAVFSFGLIYSHTYTAKYHLPHQSILHREYPPGRPADLQSVF